MQEGPELGTMVSGAESARREVRWGLFGQHLGAQGAGHAGGACLPALGVVMCLFVCFYLFYF